MNHPDSSTSPVETNSTTQIVALTQRWIERAVIGLQLCPFARTPYVQKRIRFRVSEACDTDRLLEDLRDELQSLQGTTLETCETTLLIHPHVLDDFFDYNDFVEIANGVVKSLDLEGELQIAGFHPEYQFADTAADAIENFTNRSPYPMLHLLRESSITQAIESMPDTDRIYLRNIDTLRALGHDGWQALWDDKNTSAKL